MFHLFRICRKDETSFDSRHCCQKRQPCRSNVRFCRSNIGLCRKNRSTCSIRQCSFDVVAVVDRALELLTRLFASSCLWNRKSLSYVSPSTSSQSVYLCLTSFCTCHTVFLCWLTTLIIDNTSHAFTHGIKPTCFTNLSHHSFFGTALTDYLLPGAFLLSNSVLGFSSFS